MGTGEAGVVYLAGVPGVPRATGVCGLAVVVETAAVGVAGTAGGVSF